MQSRRSAFPLPTPALISSNKYTEPISREVANAAFTWILPFLGRGETQQQQQQIFVLSKPGRASRERSQKLPRAHLEGVDGSYQYSSGSMPDQLP